MNKGPVITRGAFGPGGAPGYDDGRSRSNPPQVPDEERKSPGRRGGAP